MADYTKTDLEEAHKAISSIINKCEKAFEKLSEGTSQYTLMKRRLHALHIANALIEQELSGTDKGGIKS